jgi:hypothetical protein
MTQHITRLSGKFTNWSISMTPFVPPASDDDALAREAVARVEEEEWPESAKHRRHGAYDGDDEHKIALMAIRLMREQSHKEGGLSASGPRD